MKAIAPLANRSESRSAINPITATVAPNASSAPAIATSTPRRASATNASPHTSAAGCSDSVNAFRSCRFSKSRSCGRWKVSLIFMVEFKGRTSVTHPKLYHAETQRRREKPCAFLCASAPLGETSFTVWRLRSHPLWHVLLQFLRAVVGGVRGPGALARGAGDGAGVLGGGGGGGVGRLPRLLGGGGLGCG